MQSFKNVQFIIFVDFGQFLKNKYLVNKNSQD